MAQQFGATIPLPAPETTGGKPLMEVLASRCSDREFSTAPLPPQLLSNLLWAASGVSRADSGKRTAPSARDWRENPPQTLDIRLDKERSFYAACVDLASSRKLREFKTKDHPWPWGVIVATHPSQSGVTGQVSRLNRQLRPILGGKRVSYVRRKVSGGPKKLYTAQIGYSSKTEAHAVCSRLRSVGGRCLVLKN